MPDFQHLPTPSQSWARCPRHEPLTSPPFGQNLHTFSSEALYYAAISLARQTFLQQGV
jgi:hypothetical protein